MTEEDYTAILSLMLQGHRGPLVDTMRQHLVEKITRISPFLTSVSLGQEGTLSMTRTLLLFMFSDFKTLSAKTTNLVKTKFQENSQSIHTVFMAII